MRKQILVLILCLSLIGLPACSLYSKNYLYTPTPLDMAIKRASERPDTEPLVTRADIEAYANNTKLAWQKRIQAARGIELAEEGAEAGLGALSTLSTIVSFAFPVVGIISTVSSYLSKIVGAINPDKREGAYLDGINLLDDATDTYRAALLTERQDGSSRALTDADRILWSKINKAIYKVEMALSQRVSVDTPIATVSAPQSGVITKGTYSIEPAPKPTP